LSGLSASPSSGTIPLTVQLSGAAKTTQNKNANFTFDWNFADGSLDVLHNLSAVAGTTASDSVTHVYTSAGTFSARVNVTDDVTGDRSVLSRNITVTATNPLQVWGNATPSALTLGGTVELVPGIVGGLPPYRVVWSATPAGCSASAVDLNCTPVASGTFTVRLQVTDAVNNHNSTNVVFVVNPRMVVLAGYSSFFSCLGDVGVLEDNFSATVTGGTLPIRYTWTFGDGSATANGTKVSHDFAVSGNFSVTAWLNDSGGAAAVYNLTVPAGFPTCGTVPPPSFQPPVALFEVAAGILLVIIAVFAVLLVRDWRASPGKTPIPPAVYREPGSEPSDSPGAPPDSVAP
jgi:PKD repeat protein